MPKVSVIVPVYEVESFLKKCIESILKQTLPDLELILIDDGSPDNCGVICDDYAQKDPRIKVVHTANGGASAARNRGLDLATGEFIYFVDGDDWIHPDLLKDNVAKLEAANADVVMFNYVEHFKQTAIERNIFQEGVAYDQAFYFSHAPVMLWCKLYRANIWTNLRFPVGVAYEDDYVMPYVVTVAQKIICNPDKLYYSYNRLNENSIMNNDQVGKKFSYFLCGLQKIKATEGKFPELYKIAIVKAFQMAFKAWNCNTTMHILTAEQKQEIENFFQKYQHEKHLLPLDLKIYLWGYNHCGFINLLKGYYYLRKYRKSN